jgi:hypothetical protein
MAQKDFPLGKEEINGGKDQHKQVQQRRQKVGKLLRRLFGKALGGNLPKDKDRYRDHNGGYGDSDVSEVSDEQNGGDGGGGYVDDGVSRQNGREEPVIVAV